MKLKITNFLSDLLKLRCGSMEYSSLSIAKTIKRIDTIIFPNTPTFKNLTVTLLKKDVKKQLNKQIKPTVSGSKKTFIIDYGEIKGSCDIKIQFKLN